MKRERNSRRPAGQAGVDEFWCSDCIARSLFERVADAAAVKSGRALRAAPRTSTPSTWWSSPLARECVGRPPGAAPDGVSVSVSPRA